MRKQLKAKKVVNGLMAAFFAVGVVSAANASLENGDIVVTPSYCHSMGGGAMYCCSGSVMDGSWDCAVYIL